MKLNIDSRKLVLINLTYFLVLIKGGEGLGTCKAGELRCSASGNCVEKNKICDGVRDCPIDGLDESQIICSMKFRKSLCGARLKKTVFQCEYGGCIPLSRVCDGSINCLDGSDEREDVCGKNSCLPGQFQCKYGACIPDYKLCNGKLDCPDSSDESSEVCRQRKACKDDQFMCKYGACIAEHKICDGWKQCADGSDETPELCLITRAKMQEAWEKAELFDEEYHSVHNPMLSLTRRPTSTFSPPPARRIPTKSTTSFVPTKTTTSTTTVPPADETFPGVAGILLAVAKANRNCTLPEIPNNAEASIVSCQVSPDADYCNSNSTTVPTGVTIQFVCNPGFNRNGPSIIVCKEGGGWTSPTPTCEPILDVRFGLGRVIPRDFNKRCNGIPSPRGIQVECIDPTNLEVKSCSEPQEEGIEARFSCLPYFRPSGDLPMHYEKCSDGEWSPDAHSQFSCVPDCGLSEVPKTPYIINGQATKTGQWPWHVGIYVQVEDELKYICGGTLITEQSILTASHCVTIGGHLRNASTLVLFLGKQKLDLPDTDPFVQERKVTEIFIEDSFNHLALDSDIAILALDTPAVLSFYVRPACYPQRSNSFLEEYQLAQGNFGTVLGWGLTESGNASTNLRMAEIPVVSTADCTESHPDFFASQTRSTTYCAGYRNGTSVCNGDSGGGMFFRAKIRGSSRWYIQGLVSYGVPVPGSKKCSSLHYAVFTRVGRYADWIVRTLSRENLI